MPPDRESNGRLTDRNQNEMGPAQAGPEAPNAVPDPERRLGTTPHQAVFARERRPRGRSALRLILFVLSGGGTATAAVLWLAGHAWLGARVLAGDVLLIIAIVLVGSWLQPGPR